MEKKRRLKKGVLGKRLKAKEALTKKGER